MICPFCSPHSICLNIGFWQSSFAVLYGNVMLSILVLSTKKQYSSFLKRVCVFQKMYFKVKVLKSFNIFSDCHVIKACWSLKWRVILKSLVSFCRRTYALSVGFKMKPLRKSVFLCEGKDQLSFCRKPCWNAERGNHLFLSNWWIASVLFNFVTIPKLIDGVNIGKRSGAAKLVFQ